MRLRPIHPHLGVRGAAPRAPVRPWSRSLEHGLLAARARTLTDGAGRVVLLAYLALALFPGHYVPLGPGTDRSWMYALNRLVGSEFVHGRDVVFTYGPLGYLLWPSVMGSNLLYATVLRIA